MLTVLLVTALLHTAKSAKTVICYYENSSVLPPEDIDTTICNQVNFAFLKITESGNISLNGNEGVLQRLATLKQKTPNVKLVISVGGWNDVQVFSDVAANATARKNMAVSALYYMRTYNFDGLDIDWEYPAQRGGPPEDKQNFVDLLNVIRDIFNDNGGAILTVAVSATPYLESYDVTAICKVVDSVSVMTYDYYGPGYSTVTGEDSPLYAPLNASTFVRQNNNCNASIYKWLDAGAASDKIFIGLPFYGNTFQLADPDKHGIGAPISGAGIHNGAATYHQICQLNWTYVWDKQEKVPYKYNADQWVGYDNPKSITIKTQYANELDLGGVMIWAVNQDDYDGACGEKNALLHAIKNNLD